MAFDLQSGYGAGSGADMLQQILRQRAQEAFQQGTLQNEAQRNALLAQDAAARTAYQNEALKSLQEERAARQAAEATTQAGLAAHQLTPQTAYDPTNPAIKLISANPVYAGTLSQDTTLPSANITGSADTSGGPLKITNLATAPNPAKPTGQVRFAGLPDQLREQASQMAMATLRQQHPDIANALDLIPDADKRAAAVADYVKNLSMQPKPDRTVTVAPGGAVVDPETGEVKYQAPNRPDKPQIVPVVTIDAQTGQPVTQFVRKEEGATYGRAPSGVTENRLTSAKGVVETGNDIIKELQDPKIAAQLGPLMSRFNNVADFVGNAPPEWSQLAGQIESYSLANMGVHGMRSNTGAEAIKNTLGQGRHNPASMIAAIQGLNGFANHILQDKGQSAANAPNQTKESPEHIAWRLTGQQGPEPK